jgi:hypothetical protein
MDKSDSSNIPIDQHRGIETIDINLVLTLALADIDSTINGLKNIGLMHHEPNISNKNILVRESSKLVFTLMGQDWTYIYALNKKWSTVPVNQDYLELSPEDLDLMIQNRLINNKSTSDEAQLSQQINSNVIYFGVSDTGDWISYSLFKSGTCLEWIVSEENQIQGQSTTQEIDFNGVKGARTLIYNSIVQNNAYIPYIHGYKCFTIGENELVKASDFLGLNDNNIIRIDHIA